MKRIILLALIVSQFNLGKAFVAEFQMDGLFTTETYMNYSLLNPDISTKNFTLCLWQNVNYLRGAFSHSISYSSDLSSNAILVHVKKLPNSLEFRFCKHEIECLRHNLGKMEHQEWHHICFSIGYFGTKSKMRLFYDGNLVDSDEKSFQNQDEIKPMFQTGSLILGQENDVLLVGGSFDDRQAFSGKLSQVQVWNLELNSEDVKQMANCQIETIENGKIVNWKAENWQIYNVDIDFENADFCKENPRKLIWPHLINQYHLLNFCHRAGGKLPEIFTEKDFKHEQNSNGESFELIRNQSDSKCFNYEGNPTIWSAIVRQNGSEWRNIYSPEIPIEIDTSYLIISQENCSLFR